MKKAVIFTLLGIFLLFGVSLIAGSRVFDHGEGFLADKPEDTVLAPGEMSWHSYKKIKLALGSFDLANGLTKADLETIDTGRSLGFYGLMACLWLVMALRLGIRRQAAPASTKD